MQMTEEMQKRIDAEADKRATKLYPVTSIREMSKELVLQTVYHSGFKDGAKLILEMPEFEEAFEALKWYAEKGEGPYTDAGIYRRAESVLEALKKAGLCE